MLFLQEERCETPEIQNFRIKGKTVISIKKIRNFSRSRMMKQTLSLESSRKIQLSRQNSLNSETVGISSFSRHRE